MAANDKSPLLDTEVHYLQSEHVSDEFKVMIGRCGTQTTARPVALYLPDAVMSFGAAVDTVRLLQLVHYAPAIVVVGIGYRVNDLVETFPLRLRDFTPTADATRSDTAASGMGGADKFLGFIRDELKPWVHQRYDVDPGDAAYVGHSLAGLFGSYVLLNEPCTFRRYGLGSPSLWWDERVMLRQEQAYAATHDDLAAKVFTSVGAYETPEGARLHQAWLPPDERAAAEAAAAPVDMVADMQQLVTQLDGRAYPSLTISSEVLPREFHATAQTLNLSRSLRYLFDAPG